MYGDDGPALDEGAIAEALRQAQVIVLGFDFTAERLLIDLRDDPQRHTPPIVELVAPVADAHQRRTWLNARRAGLRPPDELLFFVWPHSVGYLEASVLLAGAAERIEREQGFDVRGWMASAVRELRTYERRDVVAAVRGGEGFETLWSRVD